jgi:GT2 family glycosyltransferase
MIPALVVPILVRPELLNRMLASIDYPVDELIIIDNGNCTNVTRVNNVKRTYTVRMPHNLGVAGSWNLGIKSLPFAEWWLVTNFDVTWPTGALERFDQQSSSERFVLSAGSPKWAAFSIGSDVVDRVGLFDESFHPAYFEDNDYTRRCERLGVAISNSDIDVDHTNSSTLAAGFRLLNDHTYKANRSYYKSKVDTDDFSEGRWSVARRRSQSWD